MELKPSDWAGRWELALELPGQLGSEREAVSEKRGSQKARNFLQALTDCSAAMCQARQVEPKQKAVAGCLEPVETHQDSSAQEGGWRSPDEQQGFSTRTSERLCPRMGRGRCWERHAWTKPHTHPQPDHCAFLYSIGPEASCRACTMSLSQYLSFN